MVKTLLTPQQANILISIPQKYVGKQIEVFYYAIDELIEEKSVTTKKSMADFSGILSETDYQSLKAHTEQARNEWNRAI